MYLNQPRKFQSEDRWSALRLFRKSKGLCFTRGEKWSRDHVCKPSVQLHVVQELIDRIQASALTDDEEDFASEQASVHTISISAVAVGEKSVAPTLQLTIRLAGMELVFLVDSGSTHSFIDEALQHLLPEV